MRRWVTLLIFGVLIATALAGCKGGDDSSSEEEDEEDEEEQDDSPGGVVAQRIDDSSFRLERLEAKLNDLKNRIDEASEGEIDHAVDVQARLQSLEEHGCGETEFACRGANPSLMCVSSLLVCDGTQDCPNGNDEDDDLCSNRARAGFAFRGRIHWDGCKANPDSTMIIRITQNKIYNYFPARVWLSARTTFDYGDEAHSFESDGFYDYGKRRLTLASPVGAHVDASCYFVTDDVVDCTITSEHTTCAEVRLVRVSRFEQDMDD